MKWLVSYRYEYCMRRKIGINRNAPDDGMSIIDVHPARWMADVKRAFSALVKAEYTPSDGPQTMQLVTLIYSAIEVPDSVGLTDADVEILE